MTESAYGLQHDVHSDDVSAAWRAIVADQARTLEDMLHRVSRTATGVKRRPDFPEHAAERFRTMVAETERFLADQADGNVRREQDMALLQSLFSDPTNIPEDAARKLRMMELANAVLHVNLATTRRHLAAILRSEA